jgi:hypothetical protein
LETEAAAQGRTRVTCTSDMMASQNRVILEKLIASQGIPKGLLNQKEICNIPIKVITFQHPALMTKTTKG